MAAVLHANPHHLNARQSNICRRFPRANHSIDGSRTAARRAPATHSPPAHKRALVARRHLRRQHSAAAARIVVHRQPRTGAGCRAWTNARRPRAAGRYRQAQFGGHADRRRACQCSLHCTAQHPAWPARASSRCRHHPRPARPFTGRVARQPRQHPSARAHLGRSVASRTAARACCVQHRRQ